MRIGYTLNQEALADPASTELVAAGPERIVVDSERRRALDPLLDLLRPGDTLIVLGLDVLGNTLSSILTRLQAIARKGAGIEISSLAMTLEARDLRLTEAILAAEAKLRSERRTFSKVTGSGHLSEEQRQRVIELSRSMTAAEVARTVGCSIVTVYRVKSTSRKAGPHENIADEQQEGANPKVASLAQKNKPSS